MGLGLIRESARDEKLLPFIMSAFLGIFSLVKFTALLLSIVALGSSFAYDLICKRYQRALIVAGAFALTFTGLWAAVGQNPLNIPAYIANSLEITRGYNQGEAWQETVTILTLGLVTVLMLIFYSLLYYFTHPEKIKSAFVTLLFGAALYLQWKHGFLQPNPFHLAGFFVFGLFPLVAFPSLMEDSDLYSMPKNLLLSAAGAASFLGLYLTMSNLIIFGVLIWPVRLMSNLESLVELRRLPSIYAERWKTDQARFSMPNVKREVGDASLDVLGYQQGIALYNQFHYTPRPIFQSHSVYTPALIRANTDFYEGPSAPEYVLQRYQTIVNRFPSLDEARLLNILFTNYTFVLAEKGYLLWRKRINGLPNASFVPKPQRDEKTRFNQRIELGELRRSNVWVTIRYEPSFLGMIRGLLYKLPIVKLTLFDENAALGRFNLIGSMAKEGFLINPVIENQIDLLRFIAGKLEKRITSFSVNIESSEQKFYRTAVDVRLYSLPPLSPSSVRPSDFQAAIPSDAAE